MNTKIGRGDTMEGGGQHMDENFKVKMQHMILFGVMTQAEVKMTKCNKVNC